MRYVWGDKGSDAEEMVQRIPCIAAGLMPWLYTVTVILSSRSDMNDVVDHPGSNKRDMRSSRSGRIWPQDSRD